MRGYLTVVGGLIGICALPFGIIWGLNWFGDAPQRNALALCDEAVKATLKAPATYVRVSDGTLGIMEYDAQNGFGVLVRSRGYCTLKDGGKSAEWLELPDSMS